MFATILAIIKAIPAVESLCQQFVAFYIQSQIDSMKKENLDAIRKLIDEKDQRDLEKAIGNPNAGQPSGDAGAVIVGDLPSLHKPPGN